MEASPRFRGAKNVLELTATDEKASWTVSSEAEDALSNTFNSMTFE